MALIFLLAAAAIPMEYTPAKYTQAIGTHNERPNLELVKISALDPKWHQSGGMAGLKFTSRKYRSGGRPSYSLGKIQVLNSLGYFQGERGLLRVYPDGAKFDDVLYNEAGVKFEHRQREKKEGRWISRVVFKDADARPIGYSGLKQSCESCHSQTNSGGYGIGLVPGSDTILSDPMLWSKVSSAFKDE